MFISEPRDFYEPQAYAYSVASVRKSQINPNAYMTISRT
jgi:hypothetical protein